MTKKEKYGYNYVQFTVSDDFKQSIEAYSEECGFKTNSDFIRAAIREKIDRIENPIPIQNRALNPALFEQITKNTQKTLELQDLILKRLNIFNEMKEILTLIKEYSVKDLTKESKNIENLLKAHKQLSIKQIAEKTNINEKTVIEIIAANDDKFELDIDSGRFKLLQ